MEERVREWLRLDRDAATRKEIEDLASDSQRHAAELKARLSTRLAFGTAGLRAEMGAGFSRLNSLTIIQTSQGLAEYLLTKHDLAKFMGVVIGFDGRHNSQKFAELTAAAFVAKGFKVWFFEDVVHTPLVPFSVRDRGACAGVMITASHNPAKDNGYKVYGSNGCQINAPADSEITAMIMKNLKPEVWDTSLHRGSHLFLRCREDSWAHYLRAMREYVKTIGPWSQKCPAFVYTPMHGVGYQYMQKALQDIAGQDIATTGMVVVKEQAGPDPEFRTVRYPNPEEAGALDLAQRTADEHDISLILANDPDADRFAAAEKVDGRWVQFSGDQVGALLASFMFERSHDMQATVNYRQKYALASAVSSQMLQHMAAKNGAHFEETLTGFKWLGHRALTLAKEGRYCLFAYEEALGYMWPQIVPDKDGIAAAMIFLQACSTWGSPYQHLQRLYKTYGYFVTLNTYWRSPSAEITAEAFRKVRTSWEASTKVIAGRKITRWRDLTEGFDSVGPDGKPDLPTSSLSQMITCWLDSGDISDQGVRFSLRTSGTEPKIKVYLECQANDFQTAQHGAEAIIRFINKTWFGDKRLMMDKKYEHLAS